MELDTYRGYLLSEKAMSFDQQEVIHQEMIEEIGTDPDALELYEDLIAAAVNYSGIRARWLQMDKAQKMEEDSVRTARHNTVILQIDMLSRYLRSQKKKPAYWRDKLGYEGDDRINRKVMGDFACYLTFINSLCAR